MTAKEYLRQGYLLDKRINSHIREKEEAMQMACSISSPQMKEDKVQSSPSGEAPFVKALERLWEMEERINAEIDLYVDLKAQIHEVISRIDRSEYQMVLRCRYIHNMTWETIGDEIGVSQATVRRWHDKAIRLVTVPLNPIII